ncbi:putative manganese-dependent inorganic diphosphatase [Dethiothermospora halolimnae]|uniref:putative manganese-dependent inorganic diphosphatase n=1 Tax=Dethiothermospora halolimnae TaxID=3114390 RepID=UPI003CCC3401
MLYIFGHKNPDTDSVVSAISLSYLKNKLKGDTIPCVLGDINKETEFILNYFNVNKPRLLENVKTQIKDLNYDKIISINPRNTILYAYKLMEKNKLKVLPVVDDNNKLLGLVTMKDIAMELIKGDVYKLKTAISDIVNDLDGEELVKIDDEIEGQISVAAFYYNTLKDDGILNKNSIVIVGDRYDIIDYAIKCNVKLIIVTGNKTLPSKYINKGIKEKVNIISVKNDTYTVSKLINQCNYVSSIMKDNNIIKFNENEYLDDVKEELSQNRHSNYPVVTDDNKYLGIITRRHILKPNKKEVILVDHNEYSQSVNGLREANILEIIDHHKLGDIKTTTPINFRNNPVGSTSTIIFNMFMENDIKIDKNIAGILLSGIISDTLLLKSPTTTDIDRLAVKKLNTILNLDIEKFAMNMFKAGTSLEGQEIDEIFFKDFKEFNIGDKKVGISQVFTLDIEDVFNRKNEFLSFINDIHNNGKYYLTLLLITDILKEGSYLLYKCDQGALINVAFDTKGEQGIFVDKVVSRKKQVMPKILEAMDIIK